MKVKYVSEGPSPVSNSKDFTNAFEMLEMRVNVAIEKLESSGEAVSVCGVQHDVCQVIDGFRGSSGRVDARYLFSAQIAYDDKKG